jgi:hypothetical protein
MCTSLLVWNKVDGMKIQKEWLLTKDVAKEFDLKEDTLKKQRYLSRLKEKKIGLPFVQFGPRTVKYNRLDIIKYIEDQKNDRR